MSRSAAFDVRLVAWDEAHAALESVRRAVFVVEQHVPEALEWDEADAVSQHALASADCPTDTSGASPCCAHGADVAWALPSSRR